VARKSVLKASPTRYGVSLGCSRVIPAACPTFGCHFRAPFTNHLTQGQNPGLFSVAASRQRSVRFFSILLLGWSVPVSKRDRLAPGMPRNPTSQATNRPDFPHWFDIHNPLAKSILWTRFLSVILAFEALGFAAAGCTVSTLARKNEANADLRAVVRVRQFGSVAQ
jgi:hypothetical protein